MNYKMHCDKISWFHFFLTQLVVFLEFIIFLLGDFVMLYQALPVASLAPVSASSTVLRSRSPILLIMKKKMKPPTIRPALSSHLAQKWTRLD